MCLQAALGEPPPSPRLLTYCHRPVEDSIKQYLQALLLGLLSPHIKHPPPPFQYPLKGNGDSSIYLPRNLSEGENTLGVESTIYI